MLHYVERNLCGAAEDSADLAGLAGEDNRVPDVFEEQNDSLVRCEQQTMRSVKTCSSFRLTSST